MTITGIKTSIQSAFVTPEYSLPVSSFDDELTADDIASIRLWDANLYPAQNATFVGVQNAVSGRGSNTYQAPGAGSVTFVGGGMTFGNSGMGGIPGLKVGASATAIVPHVNELSTYPAGTEFIVTMAFQVKSGALSANDLTMACQTDSSIGPGSGKMQWAICISSAGIKMYLAGTNMNSGWVPTIDKVYTMGVHFKPNPAGTSQAALYVYNVSDGVLVLDGVLYTCAYRAFELMVNGGTALGAGYSWTGSAAPSGYRVYGLNVEVLRDSTDAAERIGDRIRQIRAAVTATLIS